MIKLEVKNNKGLFEEVLIDDKLNVSSKNKVLNKFVKNLIAQIGLDTTGTSGAIEIQICNYIKNNEFYDGKIKISDCKPVLYSYDWEVQGFKDEENLIKDEKKESFWGKVKGLLVKDYWVDKYKRHHNDFNNEYEKKYKNDDFIGLGNALKSIFNNNEEDLLNKNSKYEKMNIQEIDKEFDGCNSEQIKKATAEQKEALKKYKEDGENISIEETKLIDNIIENTELKKDIDVIRMCAEDEIQQIKNSGEIWEPQKLKSTTLGKGRTEFGKNQLKIKVKKGKNRGIYIDNSGLKINTEKEFLLSSKTKYKIKQIKSYRFGTQIILEVE